MATTLRSVLSKFKTISRPSLISASSSSYSSYAKKQASAEDAIADNMYASGDLSADAYKNQLNQRLLRTWNTPTQVVSINKKLNDVSQTLTDAQVDADYAAGKITTDQVLSYEKQKLDAMTETNSTAYIKQQQKVQSLQDKYEKEQRSAYRTSENLRISQLPEDTSANLWEKAKLFQTLADQARLDGDTQEADNLQTSANNYTNSAKKADINDTITSTRLSVSGSPQQGNGVPSAESGLEIFNQLLGRSKTAASGGTAGGGVSPGGTNTSQEQPAPSAVSTGFTGYTSSAVKSKLESLDRQKKSLDSLYQDQADTNDMINTYKTAIAKSSGDQKTQLTIALNNLLDRASTIQNSIDNTTQNISDTVVGIQEAQQKAAMSGFNQEVRKNNLQFDKAESDLETAFKKGQIDKFEYIQKGGTLAATKAQFYDEVSGIYNQYGNDSSAESYSQKAIDMQGVTDSIISVAQNIDDYEPIFNDSSSSLTNLLGKKVNKGDVVLQDVRQLKDAGKWDQNYTNVSGVYHRIYYKDLGDEFKDAQGYALPMTNNANTANYLKNAYVYTIGQDGKVSQENVTFVKVPESDGTITRQAVPESRLQRLIKDKTVSLDNKTGEYTWYTGTPEPSGFLKAAAGVQSLINKVIPTGKETPGTYSKAINPIDILNKGYQNQPGNKTTNAISNIFNPISNSLRSGAQSVSNYVSPLVEKASGFLSNVFNKAKEGVGKAVSIIKNPVGTVYAKEGSPVDQAIKDVWGADADIAYNILAKENARQDPTLFIGNRIDPKTGQWNDNAPVMKKKDPLTGQWIDSIDGGLFRNNNITVNDFLKRYPKEMAAMGIRSFQDVADPVKSARLAKFTYDLQGIGAWHALDNDVANGVLDSSGRKTGTTVSTTGINQKPDLRTRNIELALGLPTGTYKKGMSLSQDAIDKAYRGDQTTRDLLTSEGLSPSWTSKSNVNAPVSTSIPSISIKTPSINLPSIAANIGSGISNAANNVSQKVSNYFNPTTNNGNNFWSTGAAQVLANAQKAVQNVTQPVVNTVKNTVSNVKNTVSNTLKKLKFW